MTAPRTATARQRRGSYRENMLTGFNALAELYYTYWGEFFHLAVFEPGDDPTDAATAYRQLIARFPRHEQVPNWRRRLAVVEAAAARAAPSSK